MAVAEKLGSLEETVLFYAQMKMHSEVILGNIPKKVFAAAKDVRKLNKNFEYLYDCDDKSRFPDAYNFVLNFVGGSSQFAKIDWEAFMKGMEAYFNPEDDFLEEEHSASDDLDYYLSFIDLITWWHGVDNDDLDDYFNLERTYLEEGLNKRWSLRENMFVVDVFINQQLNFAQVAASTDWLDKVICSKEVENLIANLMKVEMLPSELNTQKVKVNLRRDIAGDVEPNFVIAQVYRNGLNLGECEIDPTVSE